MLQVDGSIIADSIKARTMANASANDTLVAWNSALGLFVKYLPISAIMKYADTTALLAGYVPYNKAGGISMQNAGSYTGAGANRYLLQLGTGFTFSNSSGAARVLEMSPTFAHSSGTDAVVQIGSAVNSTGGGQARGINIQRTINSTSSGNHSAISINDAVTAGNAIALEILSGTGEGVKQTQSTLTNTFAGTTNLALTKLTSVATYASGGNAILVRNATTTNLESVSQYTITQSAFTTQNDISETPITATGSWSPSGYNQNMRLVSAAAGNVTLTITPLFTGQTFVIKRTDNSGNTLTVQMNSGNIDGAASYVFPNTSNYSVTFIKNTTNTFIQ